MDFWVKSSAERVFKHTRKQKEDSAWLSLHAGKNMFVSAQLLLREVETAFEIHDVTVSGLPEGVCAEICVQEYAVFNDGVPYPDMQRPGKSVQVLSNTTQGIWVHLWVSAEAAQGNASVLCKISTTRGEFCAHLALTVYPVTVPEPAQSDFGHEYFFCSTGFFAPKGQSWNTPLTPFYDTYRYSDDWWLLMANYARAMKVLRVNSLNLPIIDFLVDAGSKRVSATEWHIDFTLLDRFIELFLAEGSFRYITIAAMIASVNGDTVIAVDENGHHVWYKTSEPHAKYWLEAIYSSIYKHFTEKGWIHMLQLRLEDEPHTSNVWLWAKEIADRVCPGIVCGEPLDTHAISLELAGKCNQYVPRIEVYASDPYFYAQRQKAGDIVWCYSCCLPEENWWLNKFIDLPHSYSRMMKWACFSQGITGFLHWGFNYWGDKTIYGIQPHARFKGDGYIVYPDIEHFDVFHSNRGVATREGLCDWELLHMLAQKDAGAALAISRSVARTFEDFTDDATVIDSARARVLEALASL